MSIRTEEINIRNSEKKILIIDDDDGTCQFISTLLVMKGYQTFVASNGIDGLKLFHEFPMDLVISDIYMPGLDGLELISELRRIHPDIKILSISGRAKEHQHDSLVWAEALGASGYLEKPFKAKALLQMVESFI